jgi:prolyl-tRNA synthetase
MDSFLEQVKTLLEDIQSNLYNRALQFREDHTCSVDDYSTFQEAIAKRSGFVLAHWDGSTETEKKIKADTQATIRCIPLEDNLSEPGKCIYTGKPSKQRVVFAQAY